MNKKLHFKSLLLLAAMLLNGVNYVWGQDVPTVTLDFTTAWTAGSDDGSEKVFTTKVGETTYTIKGQGGANFKFNKGYFILGKSGAYIKLPAFSFNVSKIVITGNSGASGKVTQNIYVDKDPVSTETTGSEGTNTYEIAPEKQQAGTVYILKVTNANNSQITKIEIYEKTANSVAAPTISPEAGTYTESAAKEITITAEAGSSLHYTYTTDGTEPGDPKEASASTNTTATIDAPLGATTIIRAIAKKGETWSTEATATYVINDLNAAKSLPYEESFATGIGYFRIEDITTVNEVSVWYADTSNKYMKGTSYKGENKDGEGRLISPKIDLTDQTGKKIILSFDQVINKFFGTVANEAMLEVRTWNGSEWSDWTKLTITYPELGDKTYSSFETQKVDLSSYTGKNIQFAFHYIGTATTSGTWEIRNVKVMEAAKDDAELSFPHKNYAATVGSTFTAPELTKVTTANIAYESSDTNVAEVNSSTGAITIKDAGTTIIKAKAAENTEYNEGEASYTLYVVSNGSDIFTASLLGQEVNTYGGWSDKTSSSNAVYAGYSCTSNDDAIQLRSTNSNSGIVTTSSGGRAKKITLTWNEANTDGRIIEIYGKNTSYTAASELYATEDNAGSQGTLIGSIKYGESTSLDINVNYAYIGIRSKSGGVYLDNIIIEWDNTVSVEIESESQMTTFSYGSPVDFTDSDIQAYTAKTDAESGAVKLTAIEGNIVPSNTGVILIANGTNLTGSIVSSEVAAPSDNELTATNEDTKIVYNVDGELTYNYILQKGSFYKATDKKLKGGKAYLSTTYNVAASRMAIIIDGEATGIKAIETVADKNVYDLQGRKVAAPTKGLYIINGKKMIVK